MAAIKSFDVSREGKDLRLRMQAGDMTVARLSRAFQASKQRTVEFCSEWDSQKYLVNMERFSFRLNQILSTSTELFLIGMDANDTSFPLYPSEAHT